MRGLIRISNHDAGTLCDGSREARIYGPDRSLSPDLMSAAIFSESTAIRLGLKRQVVTALLFGHSARQTFSRPHHRHPARSCQRRSRMDLH